jgi:hypothetical protein
LQGIENRTGQNMNTYIKRFFHSLALNLQSSQMRRQVSLLACYNYPVYFYDSQFICQKHVTLATKVEKKKKKHMGIPD